MLRNSAPARIAAIALTAFAAFAPSWALADTPVADFATAWAAVDNYTATIVTHEVKGSDSQDRTYHYAYKKPHFAKIDIVAGPGRGGGAVWSGGDHVIGHQGGFISFVKLSVPITDGRATSLRGDTIDHGSFQSVADELAAGKVEGPATPVTIDGVAADQVTIDLPPAPAGSVTKVAVAFSRTTHLPLRRTSYAGDDPVKTEDFRDVKLNPGLTEADFT
jgi:outer membrane lipoprotein-sorting protein